jgi:hypothetical protein
VYKHFQDYCLLCLSVFLVRASEKSNFNPGSAIVEFLRRIDT